MKGTQRHIPRWFVVTVLALCSAQLALHFEIIRLAPPEQVELIRWLPHDEAAALSQQSGKPLLIDFSADWCKPCRRLESETFADDAIARLIERHFVSTRVTDSSDPAVATAGGHALRTEHDVDSFPTLVVQVPYTGRVFRSSGYVARGDAKRFFDEAILHSLAAQAAQRRVSAASTQPLPRR